MGIIVNKEVGTDNEMQREYTRITARVVKLDKIADARRAKKETEDAIAALLANLHASTGLEIVRIDLVESAVAWETSIELSLDDE